MSANMHMAMCPSPSWTRVGKRKGGRNSFPEKTSRPLLCTATPSFPKVHLLVSRFPQDDAAARTAVQEGYPFLGGAVGASFIPDSPKENSRTTGPTYTTTWF